MCCARDLLLPPPPPSCVSALPSAHFCLSDVCRIVFLTALLLSCVAVLTCRTVLCCAVMSYRCSCDQASLYVFVSSCPVPSITLRFSTSSLCKPHLQQQGIPSCHRRCARSCFPPVRYASSARSPCPPTCRCSRHSPRRYAGYGSLTSTSCNSRLVLNIRLAARHCHR